MSTTKAWKPASQAEMVAVLVECRRYLEASEAYHLDEDVLRLWDRINQVLGEPDDDPA
jgi:hypothetical protein